MYVDTLLRWRRPSKPATSAASTKSPRLTSGTHLVYTCRLIRQQLSALLKGRVAPACDGLHLRYGSDASPSKPSIRFPSSHVPHHSGDANWLRPSPGSSLGDSRAVSTTIGWRTPSVLEPVKAANAALVYPMGRAFDE
jgi:hypothetical protein